MAHAVQPRAEQSSLSFRAHSVPELTQQSLFNDKDECMQTITVRLATSRRKEILMLTCEKYHYHSFQWFLSHFFTQTDCLITHIEHSEKIWFSWLTCTWQAWHVTHHYGFLHRTSIYTPHHLSSHLLKAIKVLSVSTVKQCREKGSASASASFLSEKMTNRQAHDTDWSL